MKYKYDLILPTNLDLNELLNQNPPTKFTRVNADKLALIADAIIKIQLNYGDDKTSADGFVPLHSRILHEHNYSYTECLKYLIEYAVIECDEDYVIGQKSKWYRFTDAYKGNGFRVYQMTSSTTRKHFRKLKEKMEKEDLDSCKSIKHLTRFFDSCKFKIDSERAFQWIEEKRNIELTVTNNRKFSKSEFQQEIANINQRFDIYRIMVENFQKGEFHYTRDPTGCRFHSALTNMKKELRQFLTYDGKELVGLDISNSQPFLTLLLFKESFYKKSRVKYEITLNNLFSEMYNNLHASGKLNKMKTLCRQCGELKRTILDYDRYKKSVVEGTFYDDLLPEVNEGVEKKHHISRDKLKRQILTIFYGDVDDWRLQKIPTVKKFREKYPNVSMVFKTMMDRQYKDFAWLMQRIESKLVLDRISKRFSEENPSSPIFTIHDSLHTTEDKIEALKDILEQEMLKIIGEMPKVKVEGDYIPHVAKIPEFVDEFMEESTVNNSRNNREENIMEWNTVNGRQRDNK